MNEDRRAKGTNTPRYWDCWSEGERDEWECGRQEVEEYTRIFEELRQFLSIDVLMKISEYGDRRQDAVWADMRRMEHRLMRYLPNARDLILYAGIEGMELRGDADA